MYCRNYTGSVSHVLCREVYCTVPLLGRVHYQRVHCASAIRVNDLMSCTAKAGIYIMCA